MAMKPQAVALCALVLAQALGFAPLPAQQRTGATGAGAEALVLSALNLTARDDSTAGRPRPRAEVSVSRPGDVLEYTLVFTNPRPAAVRDIVLENPVPAGATFVAGSAVSDGAEVLLEYSIDGGRTWSARPEVEVVDERGERVRRPAPPDLYTHVRWTLTGAVGPGAKVEARYRARVREAGSAAGDRAGSDRKTTGN
jgi:uncharacterized repeat protein (TIGR01451 family)